jgi:hypothetical protein
MIDKGASDERYSGELALGNSIAPGKGDGAVIGEVMREVEEIVRTNAQAVITNFERRARSLSLVLCMMGLASLVVRGNINTAVYWFRKRFGNTGF